MASAGEREGAEERARARGGSGRSATSAAPTHRAPEALAAAEDHAEQGSDGGELRRRSVWGCRYWKLKA
jgi:hypothetical protein